MLNSLTFGCLIIGVLTWTRVLGAGNCRDRKLYEPFSAGSSSPDQYHVCLGTLETPLTVTCPDGSNFNPVTKSCSVQGSSIKTLTAADCPRSMGKFNDPLNDEETCNKYTECDGPAVSSRACAPDNLFNTILNDCVSENDWYCESDGPDCDEPRYQNRRLLDKFDCTSYYECIDDVRVKGNCPAGYAFQQDTQTCVLSTNSNCKTLSSSTSSEPIIDICKDKAREFVADPNYCMGYYYCIDENSPYWRSCGDEKYFNNGYCSAVRPNTCKCEDIKFEGSVTKKLVPHQDKNKFYVCYNTKGPDVRSCPSGTEFSAELKSCVRR